MAQDLPQDSELKQCEGILSDLSTMTLKTGQTLILKSNQEICVPHSEREHIIDTCQSTQLAYDSIISKLRGKVFWPGMKEEVKKKYTDCNACAENHISVPH